MAGLLGIFFRLFHAEWKLYSYDEAVTSLRVSGHTIADFKRLAEDGRRHPIADLLPLQRPGAATSSYAVLASLANEDPQHPPLYYLATLYSERLTGDSVFLRRLPAIVFGVLALPAAWWLAWLLFGDVLAAACCTALIALSPFHVAYAQQAREYSLWTLAICVSSALMLTVLRSNRRAAWIAYALSLAAGLWAYSFFAQIIAVHALYAAFSFSDAARRRVGVFVAIAFATLAFLPWLAVLFTRAGTALVDTTWSATGISPVLYAGKALFNAGTMFFDLDYVWIAFVPLAVLLVSIALYACYATLRNAEPRTALFLVLLGAVSALSLIVPDIVFHQKRALQNRYLAPLWLAFEFATAFTLANGIRAPASRTRSVWTGVTILFLACGAASCAVASYARTWWLADSDKTLPAIALALDGVASPTLVYVENDVILLELLPLANANLSFQLNGRLDAAALGASARPYVIAKAGALRRSPFSRSLSRVALPVIFPPPPSPAVSALRRRAAAERGLAGIEGPDELFTLPAVTRRRR